MIVLEMKCPQLSKPEATAARNENSIGDRMEKKPWEKPGSVGGPVPLRPDKSGHLPVALLSSDACELAPLRIVLLCVFLPIFFIYFLLLF